MGKKVNLDQAEAENSENFCTPECMAGSRREPRLHHILCIAHTFLNLYLWLSPVSDLILTGVT